MRRLLISIIAISLFYQVFGYLLVFNANVFLCKKEMKSAIKAGLSDSEKEHLKFSKAEYENLHWLNHKEFNLNDKMYDIISTEELGADSVLISCINDEKEAKLFANLADQIDQNSDLTNTGKPISKVLLKLLKIEGLLIKEENCVLFTALEIPYMKHNSRIVSEFITINTPPPRSVL